MKKVPFEKVKKIVKGFDPVGILSIGCPEDEYDGEIKSIIELNERKNYNKFEDFYDDVISLFWNMGYTSMTKTKKVKFKEMCEKLLRF